MKRAPEGGRNEPTVTPEETGGKTADATTSAETGGSGDVDYEIDVRLAGLVAAVSAACAVLLTLYATGVI